MRTNFQKTCLLDYYYLENVNYIQYKETITSELECQLVQEHSLELRKTSFGFPESK